MGELKRSAPNSDFIVIDAGIHTCNGGKLLRDPA